MPKTRKFKTNTDGGVTIYAPDASGSAVQIRIEAGEHYETSDKAEIDALQASPEVTEVKK